MLISEQKYSGLNKIYCRGLKNLSAAIQTGVENYVKIHIFSKIEENTSGA